MSDGSRERIRRDYSGGGAGYDQVRLETERGSFLSRHDLGIFDRMLPAPEQGDRALEVGAGTGRFTLPLLDRGWRVVATDVNEAQLVTLREKLRSSEREARCEVRTADVFALDFEDASFDLVVALHVIPRFLTWDDQRAGLRELCRVLRPGGRLIVNWRNRRSPYNLVYRGPAITRDQLLSALREGGVDPIETRTKHFLNGRLLDRLPHAGWPLLGRLDRALETRWPSWAWDLFVLGRK